MRLRSFFTVVGVVSSVAFCVGQAFAQTLRISEVYGGGGSGSAAAAFKQDFIEIFNYGTTSVDLSGISLQYNSATGTSAFQIISLLTNSGNTSLASGAYIVVNTGGAGTGGADNPTVAPADAPAGSFAINAGTNVSLSATAGRVGLFNSTTAVANFTGNAAGVTNVIDFVGYGINATTREGGTTTASNAPAPTSVATSIQRNFTNDDTNVNSVDFINGTPTPFGALQPVPAPPAAISLAIGGLVGLIGTGANKLRYRSAKRQPVAK